MHSPKKSHWQAVKRLLCYLKHTVTFGFKIARQSTSALYMYFDLDWASNPADCTSITGYILYYSTTPISWSLKKQRAVARSSTEAEYRAVASALAEINWVMNLLRELHVSLSTSPTIFCDNVGATYLCQNPVFHSRMKHIAIDFHFVRKQAQQKLVNIKHVHATNQVADTHTATCKIYISSSSSQVNRCRHSL